MLVKFLLWVTILVFFCATKTLAQNEDELNSGLYFASSEVVQDKRTSLNLTPEEPVKLTGGLTLDFDIKPRSGDGYYGYIFRIISNSTDNFDFIANYASTTDNFSLIFKDKILCTFRWDELPGIKYNSWFHVAFHLDLEKQEVQISIDNVSKNAKINYLEKDPRFDILFGKSKFPAFQSTDVCPMTLKNIRIFNHQGKLVRDWHLSKHLRDTIYDELTGAIAAVENPKWLIDTHLSWNEVAQFDMKAFYGVENNKKTDELYFVDERNIIRFNLVTNKFDSIPYLGGNPYMQVNEKHVVFNPYTNEIWSYNLDQPGISKFSFTTQKWSGAPKNPDESNFAHHNKIISPVDSSLVAMFGYGLYRYNSTVFNYKPGSATWDKVDRSGQIEPRYLAASGLLNNQTLLVFGGYGSKTGRQELSPGVYNDLHSFDLKTFQFKKLLEYHSPSWPFVPSESLIIDDDSTGFYTLIFDNSKYDTRIKLARFGIYKPTQFVYPDSIAFNFLDIESWSYLYLSKTARKLYAVTTNKSKIHIYSMAYPPLVQADVFQVIKPGSKQVNRNAKYIFSALLVIFLVLAYYLYRRKMKKKPEEKHSEPDFSEQMFRKVEQIKKSSVLFLGGFQIYNGEGVDITSDFSPTLKQLFLIIFFDTIHRGKGISSMKLDEMLWFDKSEKSARNNRNVNISKLRNAIEEVGGMEIISENSYWKLKISPNIYCDYLRVLNITNKTEDEQLNISDITELLVLLDSGELLPNLQIDWLDSYKAQYTNSVIDFLVKLLSRSEIKNNKKTLLHISDCIFSLDSLNEDALVVKCQILHKEGKGSVALHVYHSFCKEYLALLNTEFTASFNDVLAGDLNSV